MTVWRDVIGQETAVATLDHAVRHPAAMTHAWLFTGPPGSGRSNVALAFAAALQCERGTGCGECHACRTALAGSHPDVSITRWPGCSSAWSFAVAFCRREAGRTISSQNSSASATRGRNEARSFKDHTFVSGGRGP